MMTRACALVSSAEDRAGAAGGMNDREPGRRPAPTSALAAGLSDSLYRSATDPSSWSAVSIARVVGGYRAEMSGLSSTPSPGRSGTTR